MLVGDDDRFFQASCQRRVAKQRLCLEADELRGGTCSLANPVGLANYLLDRQAAHHQVSPHQNRVSLADPKWASTFGWPSPVIKPNRI